MQQDPRAAIRVVVADTEKPSPVRRLAALPLRGELHLRRRRAAGRAPRASAGHRPGAAPRAPRRAGAARAARPDALHAARARAAASRSSGTRRSRSTASTICFCASAICRSKRSRRATIGARASRPQSSAVPAGDRSTARRSPTAADAARHAMSWSSRAASWRSRSPARDVSSPSRTRAVTATPSALRCRTASLNGCLERVADPVPRCTRRSRADVRLMIRFSHLHRPGRREGRCGRRPLSTVQARAPDLVCDISSPGRPVSA